MLIKKKNVFLAEILFITVVRQFSMYNSHAM